MSSQTSVSASSASESNNLLTNDFGYFLLTQASCPVKYFFKLTNNSLIYSLNNACHTLSLNTFHGAKHHQCLNRTQSILFQMELAS